MASLQAASAIRASISSCPILGRDQTLRHAQCPSMAHPLLRSSFCTVNTSRIVNKTSNSSFAGTRFSGEPVGLVKALSPRKRQCKTRASEGRQAARDVEKKSKNIFENIVDFFKFIINSILGLFSSILGGISRLFRGKEGSAKANLRSAGDKVEGAGRDVGNAAEDAVDALGDKGKDVKRGISDGLDDASSRLKRA
eukprot:TRINITY_DN5861_c0_g2_i1.p1 TRINITY_DN5861_c0_g2~~TRINITY_DN5861_c0_g2_i1.p1  ORF type:complete len:196 (-),score=20.33 TRINITY_DN5861_c0_g2_i1:508-1095(-)